MRDSGGCAILPTPDVPPPGYFDISGSSQIFGQFTHSPEILGGITTGQKLLTFVFVKCLTFLKYGWFQFLFVDRWSIRFCVKAQENIHATLDSRTIDNMPITFHSNLSQDGGNKMSVYWRPNDVFQEKIEPCLTYFGNVSRLGVDSIL
jgi:hypothetical protein